VFITKHWKAFDVMKEIMAKYSIVDEDGLPLYVWSNKRKKINLELQLGPGTRMRALMTELVELFNDERLSFEKLSNRAHERGNDYPTQCIKRAIQLLEEEGRVSVDIPANKRPKRKGQTTLGPKRVVTFLP
jgi:hypothetical protein